MNSCELIEKCIFFNDKMSDMPSMAGMYKQRYCLGDQHICARYKVYQSLGSGNVPSNLFPNQHEEAEALLGA